MKTCSKCKCEKPLSEFFARLNSSDGRVGTCKACQLVMRESATPKPPKEANWARAKDRIRYVSGPHGQFPTAPEPAYKRAFSLGAT